MDNFIKVYYVDANGVYQGHFRLEKEGYQAKAGETTVAKPSLREPMVIEGGTWRGATDVEYNAWLQAHPQEQQQQEPSKQDQALNALGLQLAQVQKAQAAQSQAINALGLQFAQAQGKDDKTEQGGN